MLFAGQVNVVAAEAVVKWRVATGSPAVDRERSKWLDIVTALHDAPGNPVSEFESANPPQLMLTHSFEARSHAPSRRADIVLEQLSGEAKYGFLFYDSSGNPDKYWDTSRPIPLLAKDNYSLPPKRISCLVGPDPSAALPCDGELDTEMEILVVQDSNNQEDTTHTKVAARIV